MLTNDTLSSQNEALPEVIEISPEVKAVVDAFFDLYVCEERIRAIKKEIRRHPDYDRTSLDLAG